MLLFQPAEEGGAGGKFMVEEGALEGVLGVHGIHVMPIYPSGVITSIVWCQPSNKGTQVMKRATAHDSDADEIPWLLRNP